MFDLAFSEMVVIGVVALIVIGPEKLPKVARTAGILLGRAQRYANDIKSDIDRQIQLDELKKLQEQVASQARSLETSMRQEVSSVESSLNDTVQALTQSVQEAPQDTSPPAAQPVAMQAVEETVELYTGEPDLWSPPKSSVPAPAPEAGTSATETAPTSTSAETAGQAPNGASVASADIPQTPPENPART